MKFRQFRFVLVIFVVGVAISALAAAFVREIQQDKFHDQLANRTRAGAEAITFSFQQNLDYLDALHAYFDTNSRVSRDQFSGFTGKLLENATGIQAFEWIPRVPHEKRQTFETTTRFYGYTDFQFRELGSDGEMTGAGERAEYYPVFYVEPFPENQKAFGFDLASNKIRLQALQLARDTGDAVVSRRIKLIQKADRQFGVLVFKPVYRRDLPSESIGERRVAIRGVVLGVFPISDMVDNALASLSLPENVKFRIVDRNARPGEQELFSSHPSAGPVVLADNTGTANEAHDDRFSYALSLPVRDLNWEIRFFGFDHDSVVEQWIIWFVFGTGLAFTTMVAMITGGYASRAENAAILVAERTQNLEDADARMRDAIESLADGFALYDAADRLLMSNRRYRLIYSESSDLLVPGAKFADVIRKGVERGQYPAAEGREEEWIAERVDLHQNPKGPFEQQLFNGRWLRVEERRTKEGGYVGIRTDISNLKENQFALQESERRAQQIASEADNARRDAEMANMAKSNFLATMSHEIRTPMNGVLGLTQLLLDSPLNDDQRKKVDTILSSGRTLLAIINDVLDMSRIEAGGVELEIRPFSLPELLSVIATPFQSLADDKGLELKVTREVGLSAILKGDPVRLRQILWNLLSNAIKFTDSGSVSLSISDETGETMQVTESRDHTLKIVVADTGVGIAPDRLSAIFDPFTQEDSSITRKFGGTGLGLSIVNRLVGLMGGHVEVSSKPGKGTRFEVFIPFDVATEEEAEGLLRPVDNNVVFDGGNLDVLVAEDNLVNAMVAQAFLQKFGHNVRHVENGAEAVRAFADSRPDLILMDIHMPEMNGIDATRVIRSMQDGGEVPIVGLTAEAFSERHAQFREAGMNDVLTKPFTEEQLLAIVSHYGEVSSPSSSGEAEPSGDDAPATGENDDLPIGDAAGLAGLRAMLPSDKVDEIIGKAPESLTERLDQLHRGLETADSDAIRDAAHSIKGMSGSLFATRLSARAAILEDSAIDLDQIRTLVDDFDETARLTLAWWQDCVGGA